MGMRKNLARGLNVRDCPVCGDKKIRIVKIRIPRTPRPYLMECLYCHKQTGQHFTRRGAAREWNKKTNITRIADYQERTED